MSFPFSGVDENAHDYAVAVLDPLRADQVIAALPAANDDGDTGWMLAAISKLIEDFDTVDAAQARAALRDLGFLAASVVRHTPDADLSFLQPTLLRLGDIADEVPRDTVYSYTTRNPVGPRRRAFVGSPEEDLFIDSVLAATRALNVAVEHLTAYLCRPDLDENGMLEAFARVHDGVESLRQNLRSVQREITPEYFSHQLRPYFPQLTIGGRTYMGPGGAQMPLLVLDVLLLTPTGPDELGEWHATYLKENLLYLPPAHRAVCAATLDEQRQGHSELTRMVHESTAVRAEYGALLRRILRFRYPHRQVARNNMAIRVEGSVGSGGYTVTALDNLVDITADRAGMAPETGRRGEGTADAADN